MSERAYRTSQPTGTSLALVSPREPEQIEDTSAKARSLQDRIKLVERQLERQKVRGDTLQTQLDEVQRARIATATR